MTEFTADELLAELRQRERARATGAGPGQPTMRAAGGGIPEREPGLVSRFHDISEIPSGELAKLLNERQRAIYGQDNRTETFLVTDARQRQLAESAAALVKAADLRPTPAGGWKLRTTSYKEDYNLCANEPFAVQPLGCFCSGVLVARDVVATAGHCVKTAQDLARMRIVFGFRMTSNTEARTEFAASDVYEPIEIVGRQLTPDGVDWALVRLDRVVADRDPVTIRTTGKIPNAEPVFVIGHPCGLPQKLAGKANVRNNEATAYFAANLDTYGGNSGSPVFSAKTYVLEGLLVRGQTDFVTVGGCNLSTVFPTSGPGGEDVTRTSAWLSALPSAPARSAARATKPLKANKAKAKKTKSARKTSKRAAPAGPDRRSKRTGR